MINRTGTRWRWSVIVGILFLLSLVAARSYQEATPSQRDQPVAFRHPIHAQAGIQCLYCHSEAARSQIAGIPSVQKCVGCHQVIATEEEPVQEMLGYWERDETIPWRRVTAQLDFVYFSHQPHLGAALNCETCHGNVAQMEVVEPAVDMHMGWCLQCHEAQPAIKIARLVDCITCHK